MGIESYKHAISAKSFYTIKIDNFDMAELNIRIVDFEGNPNAEGRLEMRN